MFGNKGHEARISVIEARFEQFQLSMTSHMDIEEKTFSELKDQMKELMNHIDVANKENWRFMEQSQSHTFERMEREYVLRTDLDIKMTALRASIRADIMTEKRNALRELTLVIFSVSTVVLVFGWLYSNGLIKLGG